MTARDRLYLAIAVLATLAVLGLMALDGPPAGTPAPTTTEAP